MPCDQIQTSQVNLGPSDPALVEAALKEMGLNPTRSGNMIRFRNGSFQIDPNKKASVVTWVGANSEDRTKELKRSYSAQVVLSQAKKFNWQVKQKSRFEFEVTKRRL